MKEVCSEHKNKIQRICLNPKCEERALCLLCDHPHGTTFRSIMIKTSESYKTFENTINEAIDKYIVQQEENEENQVQREQGKLIEKYFESIRKEIEEFLNAMEQSIMRKLQSEDMDTFRIIKRARINKNYVNVPQNIYQILLQIYEGTSLNQIFQKNETGKSQEAYHLALSMHEKLKELMQERDYKLKVKLPDIRQLTFKNDNKKQPENEAIYDLDAPKPKFQVKLLKQSQIDFDSIISDCTKINENFLVTSYDKTIKIIDSQLQLLVSHDYSNILSKIHPIAEDVYAIAHSKQILIQNIKYEKKELSVQNVMRLKGHTEKINYLHCLNSRIVGSSSLEGVKLWDLYKEKCEYTLKDQANPTAIRFIPGANLLTVGYNNHFLKVYSIETMKLLKKYELQGVPLLLDQGKFTQNQFYVSGFPSNLGIVDIRLNKMASEFNFKQGAVTTLADSIYDQQVVATGDRQGNCNLYDLRTRRSRVTWVAHSFKTNISKPRGIVGIFEHSDNSWTTIGCNQRNLKIWDIQNVQKVF